MALEQIPIVGTEIYYDGRFLGAQEASEFFDALLSKCPWWRRKTSFGSAVPRDEAYYGDPGTHYEYSRRDYKPLPWIPELLSLKQRVEAATQSLLARTCSYHPKATTLCYAISIATEATALDCTPTMNGDGARDRFGQPRFGAVVSPQG